jgi:hypothetical protein
VRAENVAGHEVGRKLDALEIKLENLADGADERGFAEAGQPFEQNVPARQNADDHEPVKFLATEQNAVELLQNFARQLRGGREFVRFQNLFRHKKLSCWIDGLVD